MVRSTRLALGFLVAVGLGSLARLASSQQLEWQVPLAGAVEFQRSGRAKASAKCPSKQAAKVAELTSALPARYLRQLPPAPFLCEGELRRDQRALAAAVADLRDVLRAMAFDLSSRSGSQRFPRLLPFGDVSVRGSWSTLGEAGEQSLTGQLQARLPRSLPRESRELAKRLAGFCMLATSGTVKLTRTVDRERGLVTGFRGELDLVVAEEKRCFRRLHIVEQWQFVAVRDNQDFDFRKRVAAAIREGTAWVRAAIEADKSFLIDRRGERNYGTGRLALALLALLNGHVPANDEIVQKGFAALRRRRIDDAYSLATSLMAMAAWHQRASLAERDRLVAKKWLANMLTCIDTRSDPEQLLRFNYTRGTRYDTSLQQYGLLGLRAAQQIGLAVPSHAFAASVQHLLAVQAPSAGSHALVTVNHLQLRASLGTDKPPKSTRHNVKVRGFAYQERDAPAFGSMTSAGVSGLLLAREGLKKQGGRHRALQKRIDAAVLDGFAWLAKNFSVRLNPGFAERADNHWSYWLYCLERCCELDGIARLQGRDWYYEGGLQLLAAQRANGSFQAGHSSTLRLDSTCFAILFLAKASAPVPITGR
ncbi:MAG: hypothetical protein ACI85K_000898 [Hyphomicrobiaceae bacterium]|jgi:hypothetical protein